jgi:hypothetical protein
MKLESRLCAGRHAAACKDCDGDLEIKLTHGVRNVGCFGVTHSAKSNSDRQWQVNGSGRCGRGGGI